MAGMAMQMFHLFVCFQIYRIVALSSPVRPLQGPIETFYFPQQNFHFLFGTLFLAESFQSIVNVI